MGVSTIYDLVPDDQITRHILDTLLLPGGFHVTDLVLLAAVIQVLQFYYHGATGYHVKKTHFALAKRVSVCHLASVSQATLLCTIA